ncbi:MAG: pgl3 [Bacteroidetes bacterium]|nr:pgl3 [Bacteroidota bacterium]
MMPQISIFETRDDLNREVINLIDYLLQSKSTINIALSGGSTPKALFDYWSKAKCEFDYWKRIRLFWGDERCVPPNDEMSNFGMTKEHLLDKIPIPPGNIFRIVGENDPEQEAVRYGELIEKEEHFFDLVLLGLGDDGHTVSIFPSSIKLWKSSKPCVVNLHPDSGMKRITITGKVINSANYVAFLVTGDSKAIKVKEIILHRKENLNKYPAAKVAPTSGRLLWLLDTEAAALL